MKFYGTLISRSCRLVLLAHHQHTANPVTERELFDLPKIEVIALVLYEIRPTSVNQFLQVLSENVRISPPEGDNHVLNAVGYYRWFLDYSMRFQTVFDMLSFDNSVLPRVGDNKSGLIKVFMSGMAFGGTSLWEEVTRTNRVFESVGQFIDQVTVFLHEMSMVVEKVKSYDLALSPNGALKSARADRFSKARGHDRTDHREKYQRIYINHYYHHLSYSQTIYGKECAVL